MTSPAYPRGLDFSDAAPATDVDGKYFSHSVLLRPLWARRCGAPSNRNGGSNLVVESVVGSCPDSWPDV